VGASASWVAPLRISSNDERALRWAGASSEVWAGVEAAEAEGFHALTLGKRILRTETAGLVMLSLLMAETEED